MLDSISPAGDVIELDPTAGDVNLATQFPEGNGARVIEVVTAGGGALALRMASSNGTTRTLTGLAAGWVSPPGNFVAIVQAGSSVTKIRVWQ